ncbi:uncharacterized protein METZ01_LOCUS6467 [marine metagenome]|uniref:Uncharacterized protein n=1 Tax=marine metagenome TaxID=408172 RepID=A0A381NJB7_9ZZZZ
MSSSHDKLSPAAYRVSERYEVEK